MGGRTLAEAQPFSNSRSVRTEFHPYSCRLELPYGTVPTRRYLRTRHSWGQSTRMQDQTPKQHRVAAFAAKQGQAALLLAAAEEPPLRDQVRLAIRDLDEGLQWLENETGIARPFVLDIVDATLRLATSRLNMVKKALQTEGPTPLP